MKERERKGGGEENKKKKGEREGEERKHQLSKPEKLKNDRNPKGPVINNSKHKWSCFSK